MRGWLTIMAVLMVPGIAAAGAWPRADGEVFLSFSYSQSGDPADIGTDRFPASDYTAVYAEYGLTDRLTLGLDAGISHTGTTTGFAFLRLPLGPPDRPFLAAVSAGLGAHSEAGTTDPLLVLGGALGRGIDTRFGPGWINADVTLQHRGASGDTVAKADLTLGLKPRDGRMLILQLQAGDYPGSDPYVRLAPSVVQQVRPGLYLETGAEIALTEPHHAGLKLGTWLEF